MSAAPAAAQDDRARAARIVPLALLLVPLFLAGCEHERPIVVAPTAPDAKACKAKPKPPNCPTKIAKKPKPKAKAKVKRTKAAEPSFASWRLRLSEPPERERADRARDAMRPASSFATPANPAAAVEREATPVMPADARPLE